MTRRYTSEIINEIGPEKDIPAPDVGTDAQVMAWIFDTYSMNKGHSVLGVVTGKPLAIGGSLGRDEATARGSLYCIRDALAEGGLGLDGLRVAVQGFGNVGAHLARLLAEEGARVIAVSDSQRRAPQPVRPRRAAVIAYKAEHGTLEGFPGGGRDHERGADRARLRRARALRARAGDHGRQRRAGRRRRWSARARTAPTTPAADDILEDRGILVLPDVLANAGGVVVSYFEWVQGLQEYFWKE